MENGAAVCHSGSFVLQGCNPQRKCFAFISQFFEGTWSWLLNFEAQGYEMQSAAQWLPEDVLTAEKALNGKLYLISVCNFINSCINREHLKASMRQVPMIQRGRMKVKEQQKSAWQPAVLVR